MLKQQKARRKIHVRDFAASVYGYFVGNQTNYPANSESGE